jgi:hypothetical protein
VKVAGEFVQKRMDEKTVWSGAETKFTSLVSGPDKKETRLSENEHALLSKHLKTVYGERYKTVPTAARAVVKCSEAVVLGTRLGTGTSRLERHSYVAFTNGSGPDGYGQIVQLWEHWVTLDDPRPILHHLAYVRVFSRYRRAEHSWKPSTPDTERLPPLSSLDDYPLSEVNLPILTDPDQGRQEFLVIPLGRVKSRLVLRHLELPAAADEASRGSAAGLIERKRIFRVAELPLTIYW